ncbi:unnamed protein product, partial [marine sediment metagenome]
GDNWYNATVKAEMIPAAPPTNPPSITYEETGITTFPIPQSSADWNGTVLSVAPSPIAPK